MGPNDVPDLVKLYLKSADAVAEQTEAMRELIDTVAGLEAHERATMAPVLDPMDALIRRQLIWVATAKRLCKLLRSGDAT
jgi:hypothetical protein